MYVFGERPRGAGIVCFIVYEASRTPFSRFQIGAFVLPCKLLPKEAKLGNPVALALGSPNAFLVRVEPKIPPRGKKHGPQSRPSKGSFSTSAKVGGESPWPSAERQDWRRWCWVSTEAAQPPLLKLKRAPLWTLPRTAPYVVYFPQRRGLRPGTPHTSGPLSDPKALNWRPTVSIPLSSKPKYFRETRGLLAPPEKTWWRTKLPKVPPQGPFSRASLRESSL